MVTAIKLWSCTSQVSKTDSFFVFVSNGKIS